MSQFCIGVMTESFRLPTWPDDVKNAREIGADGLQLYLAGGQMNAKYPLDLELCRNCALT